MQRKQPAKIRILFDAHPLIGKKTGVGYYTQQLITHLAQEYESELELVGYYHNFLGRKHIESLPLGKNIRYKRILFIPGQIVNALNRCGINLPLELLTLNKADFILYPNFWGQPSLLKTPNANIIHDLSYIDVPEFVSEKNARDLTKQVPRAIKRSSFAITVSNFSQQRIHDTYGVALDDILVTYIPADPPLTINESTSATPVEGRYILFIGTLEPRKNLTKLLEAYALLPSDILSKYKLVLAGKIDWKFEDILKKIEEIKQQGGNVEYLGYVDDKTKALLYKNASCFVLPSLYEGFGMPILEALSYNTPVCASDIPVFREVAGEAVEYFDPRDTKSIASCIVETLSSPVNNKNIANAQQITWQDISQELYERIRKATGLA